MSESTDVASRCPHCGGSGVLIVLDWAYAREDGRLVDWQKSPYASACHACPTGKIRAKGGLL